MTRMSHLDEHGKARMVDVTRKKETMRVATASGAVLMKPETLSRISRGEMAKGDVFAVARIAGIMAAKNTSGWIPLCHPLELTGIEIRFSERDDRTLEIEAQVTTRGRTGVEMEAMTAVSAAALTIYDMCKAVDRAMVLTEIRLISKKGGKSGSFVREQ
ncbi:MAG: cyclic pyranopterin monophosphate synthase MoaC [Syntrophaceae bacterium]|nr:cyclic pyranopterin monophosphate synthase MoaC [Syntrophaceae bacterium]